MASFSIDFSNGRLILSLDEKDYQKAIAATKACAPFIAAVKVHPEMPLYWNKSHVEAVAEIKKACASGGNKHNVPVILDAKLADIDSSNQMKASYYYDAGFDAIICHGISGKDAVLAVVTEAKKRDKGVFLLVSMTSKGNLFDLRKTVHLCEIAKSAGVDGIVAPGNDYERLSIARSLIGPGMLIISPGIGKQGGDSAKAIAAGCDFFIVGRSIIDSADPSKAAKALFDSVPKDAKRNANAGFSNNFLLPILIKKQVLRFGDFTLKSGRKSAYFFNAGNLDDGEVLQAMGDAFALSIYENGLLDKFDVVFGPAYKGIPIATTVARSLYELFRVNKRVLYDRKETKDYGDLKDKLLVGNLKPGDRLLFVDDVITTGGTKFESIEKLRKLGTDFSMAGLVVLFDRQESTLEGKNPLVELENAGLKPYCVLRSRATLEALKSMKIDGQEVLPEGIYERFKEHQKMYGSN
ncbi:MAG: orotate phosphoribosyltransferase [Candidatus Micrarchaeia archaeon]